LVIGDHENIKNGGFGACGFASLNLCVKWPFPL
jgi:hypothetical protein